MQFYFVEDLGAFIIWLFKGFKGSYKECKKSRYALAVGLLAILLFVLYLSRI